MAIVEHSDALGDGIYPPQSSKDTLPKGEPIRPNSVDSQILSALKPHYSDWRFLKKSDAKGLGEHKRLRFFAKDGKHWIEARDSQSASRQKEWLAFVKPLRTQKSSGGAGASHSNTASDSVNQLAKPFLNLDPAVHISTPTDAAALKLNDNKQFKNNLVQHTFVAGDSVAGVAKRYSGSSDPSAIYNFNHPSFTQSRPPQTGDTVSVLAGRELKVDGSVQNSASVTLSWQGPSSGSNTIGNTKGGDNELISWETAIPVQAGTYTLTAKASGAVSNSVTLNIVNPDIHWLEFKIFDEDGEPVEEELDYLVRFDDGTQIRSRLKKGTDYLTGIPFVPFTIEVIPGEEKQKELDALIDQLDTALKEEVANVRANSASLKQEWEEHAWYKKYIVADFYFKKGAVMWVWDTLKGIWSLIEGAVNVLGDVGNWLGTFQAHKDSAFRHFISGNPEGVKRETGQMKAMLVEAGEDVGDGVEMAKNLYYLAHNDRIPGVLKNFAEDYFDALSPQERSEFVSRYGIDIALMFVAGSGAVLLGVKNAAKIQAYLDKAVELIKVLRFKQKVKHPNVDDTYTLGPPKKQINKSDTKELTIPSGMTAARYNQLVDDYSSVVNSNKPWSWADDIAGGANLTAKERSLIKQGAVKKGLITEIKYKPGTRYADFKGAGVVAKTDKLPEDLWLKSDKAQFDFLDNRIKGGRPEGYTWHHTEKPGEMELVPFGTHNITNHQGGRSKGHWAYAKR